MQLPSAHIPIWKSIRPETRQPFWYGLSSYMIKVWLLMYDKCRYIEVRTCGIQQCYLKLAMHLRIYRYKETSIQIFTRIFTLPMRIKVCIWYDHHCMQNYIDLLWLFYIILNTEIYVESYGPAFLNAYFLFKVLFSWEGDLNQQQ